MSLIEKLKADQVAARIAKDAAKATLLTTLLGELQRTTNPGLIPTDEQVVTQVKKFIKGINDTMEFLGDQNPKATQVCLDEKAILESYLPKQMDKDQIKAAIESLFARGETMNKGIMMKRLKENFAGQYDGKVAAAAVDELLG